MIRQYRSISLTSILLLCASAVADAQNQSNFEAELRQAVDTVVEKCSSLFEQFCSDVTPGEGRFISCLLAYEDKAQGDCAAVLQDWHRPSAEEAYRTTRSYPTVHDRELGESKLDDEGNPAVWGRRLPFLAQRGEGIGSHMLDKNLASR